MKRLLERPVLVGVLIALLALGVRLHRVTWGFPDVYEEATSVQKAWGFWGWDGKGPDFNPHFFNYPSLHFYLEFAVQALLRAGGKVAGAFPDEASFRTAYYMRPSLFVGAGRILTALLASASVFFLFQTARRHGGVRVAAPAALFLAFHSVHVEKSRYVEVDVALTFFAVLSFYFLSRAAEDRRLPGLFFGACAIGLAAATKYPGALLLFNLPLAAVLAGRPLDFRRVLLALFVAAAVFFAATPYVLLDASEFLRDFGAEGVHMTEGHFGGSAGGLLGALRLFAVGFGWPLFAVSLVGLAWAAVRPSGRERLFVPLPLLLFALLAASRMQAPHYPLPAAPPLALLAAVLLARIRDIRFPRAKTLHAAAVILLLLPPVLSTAETSARLGRKDTRTEAREWIEKNVSPGALVLLEPHGPNLHSSSDLRRYAEADEFAAIRDVLLPRAAKEKRYATATLPSFSIDVDRAARFYRFAPYQWFDYIVVTSEIRGRYMRDPDRYPVQAAFYEELGRRYRHAAVIRSARSRSGPTIDVYARDGAALPLADLGLDEEGARDSDFLAFFRSIAGLYRDRGLLPAAAKLDLALLDLNPNDSETLLHLGLVAAARGDVAGGILLVDRAARIEPGNRLIRMNLGVLLCQGGRLDEGTEIFRALLAEGEDAEVHGNLASALLEGGREEEAAAHLRRFLELAPEHVRAPEVRALLQSLESAPGGGRSALQ